MGHYCCSTPALSCRLPSASFQILFTRWWWSNGRWITVYNKLLKEHKCDSECEIIKAWKDHNMDINAYHSGSIVGNHCMHFDSKGNQIMDSITKAVLPKLTYSWIGHGLQSGPTLECSLWLSDFKTKTSFGFLTKKIRGRFFSLQKVEKWATTAKNDVFGDFSKKMIVLR